MVRVEPTDPIEADLMTALARAARVEIVDIEHRAEAGPPQHLVVAADAESEARLAVQTVVAALGAGTPGHAIAVLPLGTGGAARARITQLLDAAGVTWNGPSATSLADSAAGRTLLDLLRLDEEGWTHSGVLAVLGGGLLRHPLSDDPLHVQRWASVARSARVVAGREQWTTRLRTLASALRNGATDRALALAADADGLAGVVEVLVSHLTVPADARWTERASAALALLDAWTDPSCWPDDAAAAHARVRDAIEDLGRLDSFGGIVSSTTFLAALERALAGGADRHGRVGHGVHVASLDEMVCAAPGLLVITGAVEGAAPSRRVEDALIPDQEAAGVRALLGRADRRQAERAAVGGAVASAARCVVSCHLSDVQSGRWPSRWFLTWAAQHLGATSPLSTEELLALPPQPWLRIVPSFTAAVCGRGPGATDQELRLASLAGWVAAGGAVGAHPSVLALPPLARAVARSSALDSDVFGPLQGQVASGLPLDGEVSATELEEWATCPRRHLMAHVLRVGSNAIPEDDLGVSSLDRGTLVHRVLEKIVRENFNRPPDRSWTAAELESVVVDVHRRAETLRREGKLGSGVLADLRIEEMVRVVLDALADDDEMRAAAGWVPQAAELRFGEAHGRPVSVALPSGRTVRFTGTIDRVDRTLDGRRIRVVDYKSGRAARYLRASTGGAEAARLLQLGVYEAAIGTGAEGADVSSGWWVLEGRVGKVPFHGIVPNHLSTDQFERAVDAVLDGIEAGVHPMDPGDDGYFGPETCRFCPYDRVCPKDRVRVLGRVAAHPALEPWRRLHAIGEEVGSSEGDM